MNDTEWMTQAMQEAARCGWAAHPNPMVGAVIVKDGIELGRGYHHGSGTPHAEVMALRNASERGNDVKGADIYVTLEPCNHYGKMPPCTEALIAAGIKRCFIGTGDSDKRVRGSGINRLQQAGIECIVGFCQQELMDLNAAFFTRTSLERPYITAKWAMTADGHTATKTGSSQWITGKEAREDVHRERARHDAIIAGTQTILLDNPQLNVRLDGNFRQPTRIVLDRTLKIPLDFNVFKTENQKTILFTARNDALFDAYKARNIDVNLVSTHNDKLDICEVLQCLAQKYCITTIYCEGGASLHGTLFDLDLIDQIHLYMAPKLTGGALDRGCIAGNGIDLMADAKSFEFKDIVRHGNDLRITMKKKAVFDL